MDEFGIVTGEDIAAFAERAGDHDGLGGGIGGTAHDFNPMPGPIHGRADEIDETGIDHGEGGSGALFVGLGLFHVRDPGHQGAGRGNIITAGFDFEAQRAAGGQAEGFPGRSEESAQFFQGQGGGRVAVIVRNAAAEADGFKMGQGRSQIREFAHQPVQIAKELVKLWTAADVGVQHDHLHPGGGGGGLGGGDIGIPDAVLGAGAASVAGVHVAMAEAGIDPQGDFSLVTGRREVADHARGSNVRKDAVLKHHFEGVVAEDIRGVTNHWRFLAGSVACMPRPEDFVAGDGIDPNPGGGHFLEDLGGRTGFHGEAGLHPFP